MLIPFMQSCLNGYDDASEESTLNGMPYNAALATVVNPGEIPGEAVIDIDDKGHAYVVNPAILTRHEVNAAGNRIFCLYTHAESPSGMQDSKAPYIQIRELQKILTKEIDILHEGEEDVYGHDGINYIAHHLGKNYLTLQFQIYGSNTGIKHRISLVAEEGAKPDENGLLAVELRHNAEGDEQKYLSQSGYVSFPLSTVPGYVEGTLKGFKMKFQSLSGEKKSVTISHSNSKSQEFFPFTQENISNTKIK